MKTHEVSRAGRVIAVIGAIVTLGACSSNATGPGTGTLAMQLTDKPFSTDSVQSVNVFVVRVDGRQADADSAAATQGTPADSASMGGWTTLASPNQSVNLMAFQNGLTLPLGQASLAAGSYSGFRLVIDPAQSSVTLTNGEILTGTSNPGVSFPSGSTSGIKIVLTQPVTISAGGTTTMVIDFNLLNSFVLRGNSITQNGLLFTPVISATTK